jgi:UDP-N-acetyl-D-mannosaminuronate dehydrogenase
MNSFERIAFVGLVYIGLPTAAVFADDGIEVRVCTFISLCEYDE